VSYLVYHSKLLCAIGINIAIAVLKDNMLLSLYRDEFIHLHGEYQLYTLTKILRSKIMAKVGCAKKKEAYVEYEFAKQGEKMICDVHNQATDCAKGIR
jgi:NCK-associated protein 1